MEVAQLDQDDTLNITSRGTTIWLLARTIQCAVKRRRSTEGGSPSRELVRSAR